MSVDVTVGGSKVGVGVSVDYVVGVAVGGAWVDVAVAGGSLGVGTAVGASATCCDGNACRASVASGTTGVVSEIAVRFA